MDPTGPIDDPRGDPRPAGESAGLVHDLRGDAMLKMIFNFNFKDMPRVTSKSIRRLTTACDWDHMVKLLG